jgi:N-acetylglutamate synthase/N-acetylornithine aminotransferase
MIASVTAVALMGIGLAGMYLPVDGMERHTAQVLSRTGPRGAAAYRSAISDGVLTADEMRRIRDASSVDLDQPGALLGSAKGGSGGHPAQVGGAGL